MISKVKSFLTAGIAKAKTVINKKAFPALALAVAATLVLAFTLSSVHTVKISDGSQNYVVRSMSKDTNLAMKRVNLKGEYQVNKIQNRFLSTNIEISYLFPLTVTLGNTTNIYNVVAGTLGEIFEKIGVVTDEYDIISRPLTDYINEATTIDIVDVSYKTETRTERIPYQSTVVYSDKYNTNTKKVLMEGKEGSKIVTCSVKYVNGEAVETTVLEETVVEAAVDKTTVVGTKKVQMAAAPAPTTVPASSVKSMSTLTPPSSLQLDTKGVPVKYSSKKTMKATAYTYTGSKCATGVSPQPGYIAVDPREIPYGTKMYIVSNDGKYVYGYAIAADTGGFINGSVDLDLFFTSEAGCQSFGVRNVTVYFLD